MRILVVGGGVAGLVCARILHREGADVLVLESQEGVGGRVRSDSHEGFILDHGFQVLFTAYPAARRQLDYSRLELRRFDPGAVIAFADERSVLSDPLRDPLALFSSLRTDLVPLQDKILTARLTTDLKARSLAMIWQGEDVPTETFLRQYGFSEKYLDRFIRPFFGGVFLNRTLQTSAKAFQFYWKMLADGDTVVPARGVGQISYQLAEELIGTGRIVLHTRVSRLLMSSKGRCSGVYTTDGALFEATAVVLAVPAPEVAQILTASGVPVPPSLPTTAAGTVTLYFAGDTPLWSGRKILLNANINPFVNSAVLLSSVAPQYAPPGKQLLSVSVLGVPAADDGALFAQARHDLQRMLAGNRKALSALEQYQPLRSYRIPFAQFAQPAGIYDTLPVNESGIPGLFFAGEFTRGSSLNAAMESGENAAALVRREG